MVTLQHRAIDQADGGFDRGPGNTARRRQSMSSRSRRRRELAASHRGRRSTSRAGRRPIRLWLIIGSVAIAVGLGLAAALVLSANQPLPASRTGPPPWPPQTAELKARLNAIGLSALSSEGQAQHTHEHLDLYVDGQPVVVPANIGIDRVAGILSPIHTHDATGIIHVESPTVRIFTLGEFFSVWGVRFDAHCVGGACDGSGRSLSIYLDGRAFTGDPTSLVLTTHEEIVVAVGTPAQLPNPIPASYAFPAGL